MFGGTLGAGLGGPTGGRAEYLDFVVPGILLIGVALGATGTAISVAMDMTEGIIARFRTIAIAWCVAITLASYLWARKLYNRDPDPAR